MRTLLASEFDEYVNNLRVLDDDEDNLNIFEGYLIVNGPSSFYVAEHNEIDPEPNNTLILCTRSSNNHKAIISKPINDILKEQFFISIYDKYTNILLFRDSFFLSDYKEINIEGHTNYKRYYVGRDCGYYEGNYNSKDLEREQYFKLINIIDYNRNKVVIEVE